MKTEERQVGQSLVMQTKTLLITIVLAFCSFVSNGQTISPKAPTPELEFVMQLNVTLGEAYTVGETQAGKRHVIPITGGTFEGPLLRGTIINGGADYQLVSADGKRTTLEAIYSIKTYDGVNIHVRNQGIVYSGKDASGNDTFFSRQHQGLRLLLTASMHGSTMRYMSVPRHSERLAQSYLMSGE